MSEVALHIPETNAIDWHKLADQVFPADALRTAPAGSPFSMVKASL